MMSYEKWLACIIRAAQNIASRDFQNEAWFSGGRVVSSPDEVYQALMEDCTFDLFFQTYGKTFSEEQARCWGELRAGLEKYYDRLPASTDAHYVLNDPEWDSVRRSAQSFVRTFNELISRGTSQDPGTISGTKG